MFIQVQIVQGPAANQSFRFEPNQRFVVGRGDTADFQIEADELLSREHFALEFDGSQLTLMDLGSTNGTFVNGHALTHQPIVLKNGQQFVAGRVSTFVIQMVVRQVIPEPNPDAKRSENPTPPVPGSNFGASVAGPGEQDPSTIPPVNLPPASSQNPAGASGNSGGNFSQSIVTEFGHAGGPTQPDSLLYSNPPSPAGRPTPPQSGDAPNQLPPRPDDLFVQDHGSIAAPGGGFPVNQFPPLKDANPQGPITSVPPREQNPPQLPGYKPGVETGPVNPAEQSPFASVHSPQPTTDQMPPANPVAPVPPDSVPGQPRLRTEIPTDHVGEDKPLSTVPPPSGSIHAPGQVPQTPIQHSSNFASIGTTSSIGMPHQIPVVQPRRERPKEVQAELPPGQVGVWVRQQMNGLFFHGGTEVTDLQRVREFLGTKFESLYCINLAQLGVVEEAPSGSTEPTLEGHDSANSGSSPFEDIDGGSPVSDSPFEKIDEPRKSDDDPAEKAKPEPRTKRIGDPLFSWFPKDLRWEQPVLLTEEEFEFSLEEIWQQDSLVCFFGSSSKQIADHCHDLIRMNIRTGKQGSMFGFCWPNVLDSALESMGEKLVARIFKGGIAAILLEDPQLEFAWNIVSKNDLSEKLVEAGFVLQAS